MLAYEIIVVVFMAAFIASLFTSYPIAWLLGGLSLLVGIAALGLNSLGVDTFLLTGWPKFGAIVDRIDAVMSNWVLVSLPMFVFMGLMLDRSGVAELMMTNFVKVFGRLRGGLAITVILVGIILAASTGIVGASVVLLATMSIPIMMQSRYSKELSAGVVAASGTLGILIPPSIMLVLMADQISVPVGDLFMGALIPGVMLGLMYIVYVIVVGILTPSKAPAPPEAPPLTGGEIWAAIMATVPTASLVLAVLGAIFFGIATPTEASGIGAFGATLLAAANRKLDLEVIRRVGIETTLTTCFIFGIFIGATIFAFVLRMLGGDELIAHSLHGLPFGPTGIVIFILLISFVAGFFLDWLEIVLIILPLVAPVIRALGFDMVWFLVVLAVMLQTSFLTPPVGFSLFYLKGVVPKEITTRHIYVGVIPFVLIQVLAVILCFLFPEIVTWLPKLMYG